MNSFICSRCNKECQVYNQDGLLISGIVEDSCMDKEAITNEKLELDNLKYIYYYFSKKDLPVIQNSCNVGGKPRKFCEKCINESIANTFVEKDPHYGDGVYLSMHKNLNKASDEVRYAHGVEVSKRNYRVKFKLSSYKYLKKIKHTGGVVKTKETEQCIDKKLILLNDDCSGRQVAEFKCIEHYENGKWMVV